MKAVNLIPGDARRGGGGLSLSAQGPTYVILGLLAVAVAFVTVYVLSSNSIADRSAELTSLQAQLGQAQTQTASLVDYTKFAQMVQDRTNTVRSIAVTRFAWSKPLNQLSRVVPANTSLQSLNASLGSGSSGPGASGGASGSTGGSLLGSATAPALELTGCTKSQDAVARLMSRLRLIDGVTRVSLGSSTKPASTGPAVSTSQGGNAGSVVGCGSNAPNFDMLVTLTPLPGAVAGTGTTAATASPSGTSTPSTPTTTPAAPAATTSTTPSAPTATTTAPGSGTTPNTPAATTATGSSK